LDRYTYYIANIKQFSPKNVQGAIKTRVSWAKRTLCPEHQDFVFSDGVARIPIFYGTITADEIRNGKTDKLSRRGSSEARDFVALADMPHRWRYARIVVIDGGLVWVLQPASGIEEFDCTRVSSLPEKDTAKTMRVAVIGKKLQKDVPFILGSLRVNRYFSSGTFSSIGDKYTAQKVAIEASLSTPDKDLISVFLAQSNLRWIDFISSSELETLIAKLFEDYGCFVPSRIPGSTQTIDILATNDLDQSINVNGVDLPPAATISLQIKHGDYKPKKNELDEVDYFFISGKFGPENTDKILGFHWLEGAMRDAPRTAKWLSRSLDWVTPYMASESSSVFHSYR